MPLLERERTTFGGGFAVFGEPSASKAVIIGSGRCCAAVVLVSRAGAGCDVGVLLALVSRPDGTPSSVVVPESGEGDEEDDDVRLPCFFFMT